MKCVWSNKKEGHVRHFAWEIILHEGSIRLRVLPYRKDNGRSISSRPFSFTNTISSPPFFFYPFCSQLLGFLFSLFYLSHSYLCESHILGMAILGILSIFTMRLHCYHPPSTISSFIFGRTLDSNLIIHVKSFRKDNLLFKYSLQCGTLTGVFKDPSASWICREGLKVLEN